MVKKDKNLAQLFGILMGDGYLSKFPRTWGIGVVGDARNDKDFLEKFVSNLINKKFDSKIGIYKRENTIHLRSYKKSFSEFENLGLEVGKKSKPTIPIWIKKNKKFLCLFLRGIFDTDGCIFWDKRKIYAKPYPRILITTAYYSLAIDLFWALSFLGFNPYSAKTRRKGTWGNQEIYNLEIYGHKNLKFWNKIIGSSNPYKAKKLKNGPSTQDLVPP